MAKPDNPQYLDDKSMSLPDAKNKIDDVFLGNSIIDLVETTKSAGSVPTATIAASTATTSSSPTPRSRVSSSK
jgi:hypothetical protein